MNNLFELLPTKLPNEITQVLLNTETIRIERIISQGHTAPEYGWYDQNEHEWVIVLQGSGVILFDNDTEIKLAIGDYLSIPAHTKHKVIWTDPEHITIWLAIFYNN